MNLGYSQLIDLQTLLEKAVKQEEKYEAENGADWGSKKKSYEIILDEVEREMLGR